jgi:hypothetical protein
MPFDNPKLRVLPPTITGKGCNLAPLQPERGGGGPQRIHIEIEIIDRRGANLRPTTSRFGTFALVLLVLLLLAALAHGQQRYEHWQSTDGWHGQTRTEGSTTDWDAYGPRGEQKHCHRYFVGNVAYTTCN